MDITNRKRKERDDDSATAATKINYENSINGAHLEVEPTHKRQRTVEPKTVQIEDEEELKNGMKDLGVEDENENENEDEDEDEDLQVGVPREKAPMEGYDDLYLDTINRNVLDFDFEKLCSISLSNINVYVPV
ncbi:hypothetical protein DID88_010091 [Monilinia fructigena]|uniref:Uncharacterized protein n=1 Tax=Monilinia fructigena TaxID=38457 RepID=A0A395IL39_9HELO|nr:hypothetical protein DID88_010091 [Monilinia fructigena]